MSLDAIAKIKKDDVDNVKMMRKVLQSAKFELKGDAVGRVALLVQWFNGLEGRFEQLIAQSGVPKIEKMEE